MGQGGRRAVRADLLLLPERMGRGGDPWVSPGQCAVLNWLAAVAERVLRLRAGMKGEAAEPWMPVRRHAARTRAQPGWPECSAA
jgi:hypothetical protein